MMGAGRAADAFRINQKAARTPASRCYALAPWDMTNSRPSHGA